MKTRILKPVSKGTVSAVPSKSIAHRTLICAFLSGLDVTGMYGRDLPGAGGAGSGLLPDDIEATLSCLRALAGGADPDLAGSADRDLAGGEEIPLDCRESGSTLRFMLPICAAIGGRYRLRGSVGLMQRPMDDLETQLALHGCSIRREEGSIILSGRIGGGDFTIPGNVSSQYVSGLLMALPILGEESRIRVDGELQSKPYVDMTIDTLKRAGITIVEDDAPRLYRIPGNQKYNMKSFDPGHIEGDWSNAAFWIAAAELGADIKCEGLDRGSIQGDKTIIELAKTLRDNEDKEIDVSQRPDLVPAIALIAAGREKGVRTHLTGAGRLRFKESDRIESVAATLEKLEIEVCSKGDEIHITGSGRKLQNTGTEKNEPACRIEGTDSAVIDIDSFNDHRIVMMAAVGALLTDGIVEIDGSEAVRKSYPGFFEDYRQLGGQIEERG